MWEITQHPYHCSNLVDGKILADRQNLTCCFFVQKNENKTLRSDFALSSSFIVTVRYFRAINTESDFSAKNVLFAVWK